MLTVSRLNIRSQGFKLIAYIMGVILATIAFMALILREYTVLFIPLGFACLMYGYAQLVVAEKVIFTETDVRQEKWGRVQKQIAYSDIVEISAFTTGVSVTKVALGIGQPITREDHTVGDIHSKSTTGAFSFVIISATPIGAQALPMELNRYKNTIVMHARPEVIEFLQKKFPNLC